MELYGYGMYLVALLSMAGIYSLMCIGLNIQWGFGGLFNAGIAGFFAAGAYASALLTAKPSAHGFGGLGLPVPLGVVAAGLLAGLLGWAVGRLCLRLQSDYLAMATIGIAEILRLIVRNEQWLTNGSLGVSNIPKPFESLSLSQSLDPVYTDLAFLGLLLALVATAYWFAERLRRAPWGRGMRAVRDNETAAASLGKDPVRFRLQAFMLGSALMGVGGAMTAHYVKFLSPEATEPLLTTFLVWVMLIVGGSGNNRGAILGAVVVWTLWSATEILTNRLPGDWATRASYLRVFLIGLLLQLCLQKFRGGLLPERPGRR